MLHSLLQAYLDEIYAALHNLSAAHFECYQEKALSSKRLNLKIRIRFTDESLLEISEAVVVQGRDIETLGYRYHLQDSRQQLVFRYDDTPHFPNLATFPHHKHLPDDVLAARKPELLEVIAETVSFLQRGKKLSE